MMLLLLLCENATQLRIAGASFPEPTLIKMLEWMPLKVDDVEVATVYKVLLTLASESSVSGLSRQTVMMITTVQ